MSVYLCIKLLVVIGYLVLSVLGGMFGYCLLRLLKEDREQQKRLERFTP